MQKGHARSASVFLAKRSLWDLSCETPSLILSKQFLAFNCFRSCKNSDIVKLDLNVLYIRYLSLVGMESDHSCLYSVISLFLNSLSNVFSSPTPWFSHTWLKPYLYNGKHTDEAKFFDFAPVSKVAFCRICMGNDCRAS